MRFRAIHRSELTLLPVTERDLRLRLIDEEFDELICASGYRRAEDGSLEHVEGSVQDPIQMADALGDLVYVCFGMAIHMGIDLNAVIAEIQRSNMSKLGSDGEPIINGETPGFREGERGFRNNVPHGKILKGPRYSPPNLLPILGIIPNEEEE